MLPFLFGVVFLEFFVGLRFRIIFQNGSLLPEKILRTALLTVCYANLVAKVRRTVTIWMNSYISLLNEMNRKAKRNHTFKSELIPFGSTS